MIVRAHSEKETNLQNKLRESECLDFGQDANQEGQPMLDFSK